MGNGTYRVVLSGIQAGRDTRLVVEQLSKAFRSSSEKIQQLLSKRPVTVKSNVDRETAKKFLNILIQCGAECQMEDTAPDNARPQPIKRKEGAPKAAMGSPSPKTGTPKPQLLSKRAKKRSKWFYVGAAVAVIALLVVSVNLYASAQRKASMNRFTAYVDEYDVDSFSLTTRQDAMQALDNLYKLYNAAAETAPGFDWSTFDPGELSPVSFYSFKDVSNIIDELQTRKMDLLESMRDASPDNEVLYGISLSDTLEKLHFFERCVIRKLIHRNSSNLKLESAFNDLAAVSGNGVDCEAYSIGPLSVMDDAP